VTGTLINVAAILAGNFLPALVFAPGLVGIVALFN
jgi:hypothetical protein